MLGLLRSSCEWLIGAADGWTFWQSFFPGVDAAATHTWLFIIFLTTLSPVPPSLSVPSWTSSMWLMCHRNGERTVTVEQVHADQELSTILHSLVSELVAVISLRLGNHHPSNTKFSSLYILQPDLNALKHAHAHAHAHAHKHKHKHKHKRKRTLAGVPPCGFQTRSGITLLGQDVRGVVSRMADYSHRISGAVPSQRLALEELQLRNGWFFPPRGEMADEARQQQRLHLELLGLQGVTLGACGLIHEGQQ